MTTHFKSAFRQEVAELVVDKAYSIREAAEAMGVGKSTVDKWAHDLRKERNGEEALTDLKCEGIEPRKTLLQCCFGNK